MTEELPATPVLSPGIVALERAIALFDSVVSFSSAVGASSSAPHMWKKRGRVPAEYCPAIERETTRRGARVPCEDLRDDVAWEVLREQISAANQVEV